MKAIEAELLEIKKKMCSPVVVENLLDARIPRSTELNASECIVGT